MLQWLPLGLLPEEHLLSSGQGANIEILQRVSNHLHLGTEEIKQGVGEREGVQLFPWAYGEMGSNLLPIACILISGPWCSQFPQSWC